MLSIGLLKLRSVCARGVKGAQSGILGRIGVSCVDGGVWEWVVCTVGSGRVYRRIGLRATLTFLSLTGGQNRQNFRRESRAEMLLRTLQKRVKNAKSFSALRAEMSL